MGYPLHIVCGLDIDQFCRYTRILESSRKIEYRHDLFMINKRNKLTLLILSNAGAPVKQISAPTMIFVAFLLIFALSFIASGYIFFDYVHLKHKDLSDRNLEKIVCQQKESIANQHEQIETFAKKINTIKTNLVALNALETKIKTVVDLKETIEQKVLFGVGGSIPEDLDTKHLVTDSHNNLIREMHEQVKTLELASDRQQSTMEILLKTLRDRENLLACTPSIRPTNGWVSSRFGYRKSPFAKKREFHKGMDIACDRGTEIFATADGIITFSGRKGLFGNMVIIDHGHGLVTRYGHISKILKKRGQTVKKGETIATVGNTGRSTGPHLHYEVLLNGVQVNPSKYILN